MSQPTQKPQVIIFDWDNTLADTWQIIYESLKRTFEIMGKEPMSFNQVLRGDNGIHGSLRTSFPKIFGDDWEVAKQHYFDSFLSVHLDEIKLLDGAGKVMQTLTDLDIELHIVSNKTGEYLREEVEHLGWSKYFVSIVGATDATEDKPTHHPISLTMEKSFHQFDKSELQSGIWMVGDSKTDLETAINANIVPVLFGNNLEAKKYLLANDVDMLHFEDHTQLLDLLDKF